MSCQLTKLNSMRDHDIQELVWENGQLVLRSLSKITQKKPPWDGERSRYQTADSVSGNSLLGLHGRIHQYNKSDSSYPNCMHDGSLQHMDDSFELLHERCCYTKRLMDSHVVSVQKFANHKHDSGCYDKQLIDSHVFPFANHKKDYASKVFEGIQHKTTSNGEVPQSSLQQCQDSVRLMRSSIPVDSIPGNAAKSVRNLQNKPSSVPTKLNATKPGPEPPNESVPDEQPVAVCCKDDPTNKKSSDQVHGQSLGLTENISKEKPSNRESIAQQLIASSSTYSHGASNNPRFRLKRKYKHTEGSAYVCEKQNKRKMHALQELIPNCNKVDEVAILDDAIEYIKILQLQLQMISMRSGLFMPPLMLPMTMQQINTPHFAYPPKVAGMDTTRMQMGLGCCPVQFPTSSFSGATAPAGITENRLGYPGQVLPMSISGSPFVSFPGGPSIHSVPKFDTSQVPAPMEFQCFAPLSGEKKSEP